MQTQIKFASLYWLKFRYFLYRFMQWVSEWNTDVLFVFSWTLSAQGVCVLTTLQPLFIKPVHCSLLIRSIQNSGCIPLDVSWDKSSLTLFHLMYTSLHSDLALQLCLVTLIYSDWHTWHLYISPLVTYTRHVPYNILQDLSSFQAVVYFGLAPTNDTI